MSTRRFLQGTAVEGRRVGSVVFNDRWFQICSGLKLFIRNELGYVFSGDIIVRQFCDAGALDRGGGSRELVFVIVIITETYPFWRREIDGNYLPLSRY